MELLHWQIRQIHSEFILISKLSMYCLYMRLKKYSLKKTKYFEIGPNPKSQSLFVYDLL